MGIRSQFNASYPHNKILNEVLLHQYHHISLILGYLQWHVYHSHSLCNPKVPADFLSKNYIHIVWFPSSITLLFTCWTEIPPLTYFLFQSRVGHSCPTSRPLPCSQIWTACIVTSRELRFGGGLSSKKTRVYYFTLQFTIGITIYWAITIEICYP